jgi:hypothetical protein
MRCLTEGRRRRRSNTAIPEYFLGNITFKTNCRGSAIQEIKIEGLGVILSILHDGSDRGMHSFIRKQK